MTRKRKIAVYLLVFCLPVLIYSLAPYFLSIEPFGNFSYGTLDLRNQYGSFLRLYRNNLFSNPGVLFYNQAYGMGGELAGLTFYYLFSPFNLLVFLFKGSAIYSAVYLITVLKLGCGALAMAVYLRKYRLTTLPLVLITCAYTLMGWTGANFINIMWLDTLYLLPLLALGIDRLIQGKPLMYVLILTLQIYINFYMGFMLCLFAVLYFAWRLYVTSAYSLKGKGRQLRRSILLFTAYSLSAGLLAILPLQLILHSMALSKGTSMGIPLSYLGQWTLNPLDLLAKLMPGSTGSSQIRVGYPNIYLPAVLILGYIYLVSGKQVPLKARLSSLAIIAVLIISMSNRWLNLIWHGFANPVWYLYRYSFILSFFVIVMVLEFWCRATRDTHFKLDRRGFIITCGFVVLMTAWLAFKRYKFLDFSNYTLGLLDYYTMPVFFYVYLRVKAKKGDNLLTLVLGATVVLFGIIGNTCLSQLNVYRYAGVTYANYYHTFDQRMQEAYTSIASPEVATKIERTSKTLSIALNDAVPFNVPIVSGFSSTLNRSLVEFTGYLGAESLGNSLIYTSGTVLTDSLYNVRYVVTQSPNQPNYTTSHTPDKLGFDYMFNGYFKQNVDNYHKLKHFDAIDIYENPNPFGWGFIPNEYRAVKFTENPFNNLNQLYQGITGTTDDLYTPVDTPAVKTNLRRQKSYYALKDPSQDATISYHFNLTAADLRSNNYYLSMGTTFDKTLYSQKGLYLDVNGEKVTLSPARHPAVHSLGLREGANTITVNYPRNVSKYATGAVGYKLRADRSPRLYQAAKTKENTTADTMDSHFKITDNNGSTRIKGVATLDRAGSLIATVPYDSYWQVQANGKDIPYHKGYTTFMRVQLPAGTSKVTFRYVIPHLWLLVTFTVALLTALLAISWRLKIHHSH